ncbi:hypothetical protein ACUN0G_20615 [Pseudomonas sp. 32A]|jgi:hypothetical protein|uniref:hypothetical protein n=1 Tax=Pseudomonas sp. 32A TaxID=651185 RepID=UPI00404575C0
MTHERNNVAPARGIFNVSQSVDGPFEATSIEFSYGKGDLQFSGRYVDGLGRVQLMVLLLPAKEGSFSGEFNADGAAYYMNGPDNKPVFWDSVSGKYDAKIITIPGHITGTFDFTGVGNGLPRKFAGDFNFFTKGIHEECTNQTGLS